MARARKDFRELTVSEAINYGSKTATMLRIPFMTRKRRILRSDLSNVCVIPKVPGQVSDLNFDEAELLR